MKSIKSFSQFITEEVEVIPPAQKAKLDADAAAAAAELDKKIAADKSQSQATTTPASTAATPAPAPVRTVPTVTDYNAAIGQFDELPLQNKTMDTTAAKAWLIVTRDKAQKPADYTKNIQILKTNFPKGEDSAQKMLAIHFKYPVDFLQQQPTAIAGSKYTGVNLQADQYTLGTVGKSANYSISFINPSLQAQVK